MRAPRHRRDRQGRQRRRPPAGRARRRGGRAGAEPAKARELLPSGVELAQRRRHRPGVAAARPPRASTAAFNCMGLFEQWFADPGVFDRVNARAPRNVVAAAREAGAKRVVHTSTFDVFHADAGGTVTRGRGRRLPEGHRLRALQAARRGAGPGGGRDGIEVVIVNPSERLRTRALAGHGHRPGHPRRDPPPPAGRPARRHDARLRGRRRRGPPGGIRPGQAGRALHPRRRLRDRCARCSPSRSTRPAAAGCRPTMPRAASRGAWRAPARPCLGSSSSPPLLGTGQLTFLLWQAGRRTAQGRDRARRRVHRPGRRASGRTVRWMARPGRI